MKVPAQNRGRNGAARTARNRRRAPSNFPRGVVRTDTWATARTRGPLPDGRGSVPEFAKAASRARGFTLLEMIVATLIMAIAVVGLLSGISGAVRNAARVREYDRIVQLARLRMNDLLLDPALAANGTLSGSFNPLITGGLEAGWQARASTLEMPPAPAPNQAALDRIELQIWWMSGPGRRTFTLEAFRQRLLKDGDIPPAAQP